MIGEIAPNFILKDQTGNDFELYSNLQKNVLLVFYPKDHTTVCTAQLKNYKQNINKFDELRIKLVGINTGTLQSHKSFCDNLNLDFPVLSDADKSISKKYNAINLFGTNKRKLVLVNTYKRIVYEKLVWFFKYINATNLFKDLKAVKYQRIDLTDK